MLQLSFYFLVGVWGHRSQQCRLEVNCQKVLKVQHDGTPEGEGKMLGALIDGLEVENWTLVAGAAAQDKLPRETFTWQTISVCPLVGSQNR